MQIHRSFLVGLALLAASPLLFFGCLEELPSDSTTPPPMRTSDDASGAGRRGPTSGARGQAGVPGGLGMRGGGQGAPHAGASGVKMSSAVGKPPWRGGPRARVVIEEFTDFECPFCRRGWKVMQQVLRHYGARVRLVFRHMPITKIHPQAMQAAEAAVCAQRQGKFWAMQDMIFANNRSLSRAQLIGYARRIGLDVARFKRELDGGLCRGPVLRDMRLAKKRVVTATPAFFINGTKVEGAYPFSHFKRIIDAELGD